MTVRVKWDFGIYQGVVTGEQTGGAPKRLPPQAGLLEGSPYA